MRRRLLALRGAPRVGACGRQRKLLTNYKNTCCIAGPTHARQWGEGGGQAAREGGRGQGRSREPYYHGHLATSWLYSPACKMSACQLIVWPLIHHIGLSDAAAEQLPEVTRLGGVAAA